MTSFSPIPAHANGAPATAAKCRDDGRRPLSPDAVLKLLESQKPVIFSDVHITGDLDLDRAVQSLPTRPMIGRAARVTERAFVIKWSTICGNLRSEQPRIFGGPVDLSGTDVLGKLVIANARFEADFVLRRANFAGQVHLGDVVFRAGVDVGLANRDWKPEQRLDSAFEIVRATFERGLAAQDARFPTTMRLTEVTFSDRADFSRAQFDGDLIGTRLSVTRELELPYVAFMQQAKSIELAGRFNGPVSLYAAAVPATLSLKDSVFSSDLDLRFRRYPRVIILSETTAIDAVKVDWANFDAGQWWTAWFGRAPSLPIVGPQRGDRLRPSERFLRAVERHLHDTAQVAQAARARYRLATEDWCGRVQDELFGCWVRWARIVRNLFFLWCATSFAMWFAQLRKTRAGDWKL